MGQKDLPLASGAAHVKAFERIGWVCCAKTKRKNPHFLLEKEGEFATLSIPAHGEVKRALLQKQIQRAGITEEDYLAAFHKRGKYRKSVGSPTRAQSKRPAPPAA